MFHNVNIQILKSTDGNINSHTNAIVLHSACQDTISRIIHKEYLLHAQNRPNDTVRHHRSK